jgi:hypothetical protein
MAPFTDPEAVGTDLPDLDPSTECKSRECRHVEAGGDIGTDIDAVVLEVFER